MARWPGSRPRSTPTAQEAERASQRPMAGWWGASDQGVSGLRPGAARRPRRAERAAERLTGVRGGLRGSVRVRVRAPRDAAIPPAVGRRVRRPARGRTDHADPPRLLARRPLARARAGVLRRRGADDPPPDGARGGLVADVRAAEDRGLDHGP